MGEEWFDRANEVAQRNPRRCPFGYFAVDHWTGHGAGGFSWFGSVEELTRHLGGIEPQIYGLGPGDGLEELQKVLQPFLAAARQEGLTETLRVAVNESCSRFSLKWWGAFSSLCEGRSEFARDVLDAYLGADRAGDALPRNELDEYAEFLTHYAA
jgi:hypothetical protein